MARHPIRKCVKCLSEIGFGCKAIGKMMKKNHGLIARWSRQEGIAKKAKRDGVIWQNGQFRKRSYCLHKSPPRKLASDELITKLLLIEMLAHIRQQNKMDRMWDCHHPAIATHRAVKHQRHKRLSDPRYRAMFYARKRVRQFCKRALITRKKSCFKLIGCNAQTLVVHLQQRFKPGMSWANHGHYWHIDHIIPLASARTNQQIERLCHYTNLQPLTAKQNLSKGDKMMRQCSLSI